MNDALDFLVAKNDLRRTRFAPGRAPDSELAPGQVLVRIDRFALTANNVTYGALGEQLGYWAFFPADEPEWGRVPVWGFGDVVRSRHDGVPAGERLYGYFPISTHVVLQADRVSAADLVDAAPHRAALPPIYNRYQRVAADPAHERAREPALATFRPLFATSWLLDDFLAEQGFFDARTLVVSSASSKTALGLAFLLSTTQRERCRVVALTASAHEPFVQRTGYYDVVLGYGDVAAIPVDGPAVYVDFSGNREVRAGVHRHLGDRLRHSCAVGLTHWERMAPPSEPLPGPAPSFFFAPDQARKRVAELGPVAFNARLGEALGRFLASAGAWLRIVESRGPTVVEATYRALLDGQSDPTEAHVLAL